MKILICMLGIGGGGAERVLIDLLQEWARHSIGGGGGINPREDIDLFLIELNPKDAYYSWCKEHLRKVFTFPHLIGKFRFLNKIWKRKIIKNPILINRFIDEEYDLNLGFLEGVSTIFISQKKGGKKVGYVHTTLYQANKGQRKQEELQAYLALDMIVCVSNFAKDSLLDLYPELQHKKIEVIYNPINKTSILQKANEILGIKKEKFVFLQVGRIVKEKGVDILLEASKILRDRGLDFEVWFAGEGRRYQKKLRPYIKQNHLCDIVKFLGFQPNPYALINVCDCLISSSRFEGFSLVLLEACALGKPIIASNIPTSREVLSFGKSDGGCALFFDLTNVESLVDRMEQMMNNAELRLTFAKNALKNSAFFDLEIFIEKINRIFELKVHQTHNP